MQTVTNYRKHNAHNIKMHIKSRGLQLIWLRVQTTQSDIVNGQAAKSHNVTFPHYETDGLKLST